MDRPNLVNVDRRILEYIEHLENKLNGFNNNGAVKFMAALNRKLELLAEQIDNAKIDFEAKDDKLYERFLNTAKIGKDLASDFKAFILEYGDTIKEDTSKKIPLVERHARKVS